MIVKITVKNNRFALIESREENLDKIGEAFTYEDMSNCFVGGRFKRENIKHVCFLTRSKKVPTTALLPVGFLSELEGYLTHQEAKYKIIDLRTSLSWTFTDDQIKSSLGYLTLYDYQIGAVRACMDNKSGIVKAATGSGKTEMFLSLCKLTGLKTIILFARIDLAHQTLERVVEAGLDGGIVQGNKIDENHKIVMATVQSGHKLTQLDQYEMVIVDETHRASSAQYLELLSHLNCRYRFGFSATPFSQKDKYKAAMVRMWLGSQIYSVDPDKLLDDGRIARPTIRMIPISKPDNIENLKWPKADSFGIIQNSYRNRIIINLTNMLKGQVLILVKAIEHGETLSKEIPGAIWLSGGDKSKIRQDVVKKLNEFPDDDGILIASTIFDEGVNLKNISSVIIACGGSSYVKTLQRIGRGTRITDKKNTVDIYDFYDSTNPILLKHSKERMKHYAKEKFTDIKIVSEALIIRLANQK